MIFSHVNVGSTQWPLHWAEGVLQTTMKSHVVKSVVTWSISPDENNNIGLVYSCLFSVACALCVMRGSRRVRLWLRFFCCCISFEEGRGSKYHYMQAIYMAFRRWVDEGATLNAGLVALRVSLDQDPHSFVMWLPAHMRLLLTVPWIGLWSVMMSFSYILKHIL